MWKSTPRNTYTQTAKSKSTSNKLKEEIYVILKTHYPSEQKKVGKLSISWQTIGKQKRREEGDLFQGVYMKNKLKSEIFSGKRIYK